MLDPLVLTEQEQDILAITAEQVARTLAYSKQCWTTDGSGWLNGEDGTAVFLPGIFTRQLYTCPASYTPGPNHSDIIGCGAIFQAEPDSEGIVDCPRCGMWFSPVRV
jgi:hypothetical protein